MSHASVSISRRAFLRAAAAAGVGTLLAACGSSRGNSSQSQGASDSGLAGFFSRAANTVEFVNPLAIPPLAASTIRGDRRTFDLVAQSGMHQILPGRQTATWGFNGPMLGPTLRARRGEHVLIRFRNELDETTTLHWHGMHLPAAMDGGPHQPVAPGQTWEPHWEIKQSAATLWYHPHPHGETERHVYRGLAGLFIIDDEAGDAVDLPKDYGIDDIPVIVQDKVFNRTGQLEIGRRAEIGLLGDTILVNGTYAPYFQVTRTSLRMRILNGSTARIYNFGFDDNREFLLIGTDGGLLTAPHPMSRIQLSPGERAEIVVRMDPDSTVIFKSYPPDLGTPAVHAGFNGGNDAFDILQLHTGAQVQTGPEVPQSLVPLTPLQESAAAQVRSLKLAGRSINGLRMDMQRIDKIVIVDTTEIWEVINQQNAPHNFHIHDVQFQILTIDGNPPPPELAGWKDTIYTRPQTLYRLIMRFEEYTSIDIPYMYHCHLLLHEDQGMMGQFVVVEPGEEHLVPQRLPDSHHHH